MGCSSCSTDTSGAPKGCKNNGTCGSDGCNKMTVFNWLSNMEVVSEKEVSNIIEVRFKNGRKEFYRNKEGLSICIGDLVVVKGERGYDLGHTTLRGGLIQVQMKKKKIDPKKDLFSVLRKATQKDIDIWTKSREKEESIKKKSREMAIGLKLKMKISDIEFQGDGSKVTVYYTAGGRVDFRQLVREMAREFHTRIEMKQVGARDEARLVADYEKCGQHCCCKGFLKVLSPVSMRTAKQQKQTLDPKKISGRCGRLMCCLRYEDQTYQDLKKNLPHKKSRVGTPEGPGIVLDGKILTQLVLVELEHDRRRVAFPLEDLSDPETCPRPWEVNKFVEEEKPKKQKSRKRKVKKKTPSSDGDKAPEAKAEDGSAPKKKKRRRRRRKGKKPGGESDKG